MSNNMEVKVGDVWETNATACRYHASEIATGKVLLWWWSHASGNLCSDWYSATIVNGEQWTLMHRDDIDRPDAGEKCSIEDCLLFGIGTKEEWKYAQDVSGYVILDENGELPKPEPEEDSEDDSVINIVRELMNVMRDASTIGVGYTNLHHKELEKMSELDKRLNSMQRREV